MQQAVSKIQNESTLPSCVDTSLVNETLFASDAEDDTLVKHGSPAIRGEIFQASDSEDVGEESIVQGGGDRCEVFQASDAEEDEPGNCKTDGLKRARQPRTSAKAEFLKKRFASRHCPDFLGLDPVHCSALGRVTAKSTQEGPRDQSIQVLAFVLIPTPRPSGRLWLLSFGTFTTQVLNVFQRVAACKRHVSLQRKQLSQRLERRRKIHTSACAS